jgi:hypothetical protein
MKIVLTAGLALTFALVLGACEDADIAAPTSTPEVANLERTPPSATGIVSRGTWNQWWWIRHGASDATVVLGLEDLTAARPAGSPEVDGERAGVSGNGTELRELDDDPPCRHGVREVSLQ